MSFRDDIMNGNYELNLPNGNKKKKKKSFREEILAGEYEIVFPEGIKVEEIAPVKEDKRTWSSGGSFSDGYQFGDLTKSILGTSADLTQDFSAGIIEMPEKIIDAGAILFGKGAELFGNDNLAEKTSNFIKKDIIDSNKLATRTVSNLPIGMVNNLLNSNVDALNPFSKNHREAIEDDEFIEKGSLLGEKTDSLVQSGGQLAGTIGLQMLGVPWQATTGVTSFGAEAENALKNDATYNEALFSSTISAGSEILFESLFKIPGIKATGSGKVGNKLIGKLVDGFTNNVTTRNALNLFLNAGGEGVEEVGTSFFQRLGQALSYEKENTLKELAENDEARSQYISQVVDKLFGEEARSEYGEAFIGGAMLGGGFGTPNAISMSNQGRDINTGLTTNEQTVVDKTAEKRIVEAEKDGTKLTNKEKNKIIEETQQDLEKGLIDTTDIESVLGGETYNRLQSTKTELDTIQKEIAELESKPNAEITVKEREQLDSLRAKLETIQTKDVETQLQQEVQEKTASDTYLQRSYYEKGQRSKQFTYEANEKTSELAKVVYDSASRVMNNTTRSHELADAVAKIAEDRGSKYVFVNNEMLKRTYKKLGKENTVIDGYVNKKGETIINIDSPKLLNKIVGHETAHLLEGTNEYKLLQEAVKEYATTKGEYDSKLQSLTKMYEGTDADIEAEITSDLVGDYLFTDEEFVKHLSAKQPNVFKKVYDYIKHLVKQFTAGSKEARQLEKVKYRFEQAYKQKGTQDGNTKLSMSENTIQGLENYKTDEIKEISNSYIKEKLEENGIYDVTIKDSAIHGSRGRGTARTDSDLDIVVEYDGNISEDALFDILNEEPLEIDGIKVDINPITGSKTGTLKDYMERSNAYDKERLAKQDTKYSLSDNQGRELTKEQQEYFKDSKVRDDEGNLLTLYHGTNADFNVFKKGKRGYLGPSIYLSDERRNAERYTDYGMVKEVYANITNPLIVTSDNPDKQILKVAYGSDTVYNRRATKQGLATFIVNSNDLKKLQGMGYDGIIWKHPSGNEYTVFNPNQLKNVDNLNPTENPDIRYSLSEDTKGRKLTDEQKEYFKYVSSKLKDANGNIKPYYHGTKRADRVGTMFDPNKATSGPMAFFTDNEEIASNYSKAKKDTSLSREYDTELDLFKANGMDLNTYWNSLSKKKQGEIAKKGSDVGFDEDFENIVYEPNASKNSFGGQYEWHLEHGMNAIQSLYKVFIEDGNIMYEDMVKFKDILELVGVENVEYLDIYKEEPKVYEVYLKITNPFDTSDMPEDIINQLKEASKTAPPPEFYNADGWDKTGISAEEWMKMLNKDLEDGTAHAWTIIPDWVTDVLKANGYDGIVDTGGKHGGETHQVVIPFYSEQIKDVNNQNPTVNPDITMSLSDPNEIAPTQRGTRSEDVKLQDAIAPIQQTINELSNQLARIESKFKISEPEYWREDAPVNKATLPELEQQHSKNFQALDDNLAPAENDLKISEPEYWAEENKPTKGLFYTRDYTKVGDRKTKAYQYEHPEVRPYFQEAAEGMLYDLNNSIKGERIYNDELYYESGGEKGFDGTKRFTADDIAEMLDGINGKYKMSYDDIREGLEAIIKDNGAENNAVSKRIEFYLDQRLRNGYTEIGTGAFVPPNQEYLNVVEQIEYTEHYSNIPVDESLAPLEVEENVSRETKEKYLAIEPEPRIPSKEPKMIRVKPDTEEMQKVAEILTEEPKTENDRNNRKWAIIKANVFDKGMVFEDVSLKHKNRELMGKWDYTLTSEARGQNAIGQGHYEYDPYSKTSKQGSKPLNDIRAEIENSGHATEFYEYIYHKHNVDRMSLERKAQEKIRTILRTSDYSHDELMKLANKHITEKTSTEDAKAIEFAKEYKALFEVKNKPVFGESVTAKESQEIVNKYESTYPEFMDFAKDIYDYTNADRQVLVNNGVISQETADLWQSMYPHYVPIRRVGHIGSAINVPLDTGRTGVNAPIKRATGGNKDILPLFDTMALRTLQTYRATAKNDFGVELMNTIGTKINSQKTSVDEVIDSVDSQEELLQEGKNGEKPTFTVFENGEKVTFEITKDMYDALKPISESSLLSKTFAVPNKISNFHRGVLTEYNPVFMLTNGIKDAQDILINSQHPVRTYAKVGEAFAQLVKKGYWYQEYMNNGGEHNSYFDSQDNTFKTENKGIKKLLNIPPLSTISKLNNFIEMTPRLAEYIASREMGRSVQVSMLDAARVTTNFKAGGNLTKFLNRNGATFLNASTQGLMQQVRNIREAKSNGAKGWMNLATKFAIAGLPAVILNALLWEDDEEYEELSDYVKQSYYIVGKTEEGKFIRIPKGRTLAVIQEATQQISNIATGNDEADLKSFIELALTNLAPNNPIQDNILSPVVQVASNTTWYGEDLVPTRLQDLPEAEQFDESTDAFSKWLGEKINYSPVKINYLLDQYTGGVGDVVLPMMTPEAESGAETLGEKLIAPLNNKFTTDAVLNNQNVADFYDKSDELTTEAKKSKATDEDVLRNKYMNSVKGEMNELYKQKRGIQNSVLPNSVKYDKVREIQAQINELAKEGLGNYNNVEIKSNYSTVGDREYYKTIDGEWEKVKDKEMTALKDLGMTIDDKDRYFKAKNEISEIEDSEAEDKKTLKINAIRKANLNDEQTAYLYDKYYASTEKLDVVLKTGIGMDAYLDVELQGFTADTDEYTGKTINGSKKNKVFEYINTLDLEFEQKSILAKMYYPAYDDDNYDIIEYLNNDDSISYEDMINILKTLKFEVDEDGNIWWD